MARANHPNHFAKYLENSHAKQNRELRQQVADLQGQIKQMELDSKVKTSQAKLKETETKHVVAKAQPFVDQQGKGRKSSASTSAKKKAK